MATVVDQIDATEMMLYRWPETVAEDRFDHTMTLHEHTAVLEETIEMHVREKTEHQVRHAIMSRKIENNH